MDWLEQLFGLNPDGGDGSVERLLVGAVIIAAVMVISLGVPGVRESLRRALRRRVTAWRGGRPRA